MFNVNSLNQKSNEVLLNGKLIDLLGELKESYGTNSGIKHHKPNFMKNKSNYYEDIRNQQLKSNKNKTVLHDEKYESLFVVRTVIDTNLINYERVICYKKDLLDVDLSFLLNEENFKSNGEACGIKSCGTLNSQGSQSALIKLDEYYQWSNDENDIFNKNDKNNGKKEEIENISLHSKEEKAISLIESDGGGGSSKNTRKNNTNSSFFPEINSNSGLSKNKKDQLLGKKRSQKEDIQIHLGLSSESSYLKSNGIDRNEQNNKKNKV